MSSRKEEREARRQQRLEAERRQSQADRRKLLIGYTVAGLLAAAVIAGIVVATISGGDGGSGSDSPAINSATGYVPEGAEGDEREGTAPPEQRQLNLRKAARAAGCELRSPEDEGNGHLGPSEEPPEYGTNPPTSGNHDPRPLADGAYKAAPPQRHVIHSLEHGRVAIQYDPELPEQQQLAIKGVFDADRGGMLLFPNPEMPYAVAATAWAQLLGCERYDEGALDALQAFRDQYRGRGPEAVPF